jgi:hypothetical protein
VRDDVAIVKIYFTDMKIKHTDESTAYSWSAFFSDLGNSLGLLLGASVLSLIEVLDMIVYLQLYCFRLMKFRYLLHTVFVYLLIDFLAN